MLESYWSKQRTHTHTDTHTDTQIHRGSYRVRPGLKIARLQQAAIAIDLLNAIYFIICIVFYELLPFYTLHALQCIICIKFYVEVLWIYPMYSNYL